MARDASITLDWADGTYTFRLAWGQLGELQDKCDAGPFVILRRLQEGTWRIQDIGETIRLALIGGGLEPAKALKLVRLYVQDRPPAENLLYAQAIMAAAVLGAPEEDASKKNEADPVATGSTTSPTASFASDQATASVQ
jgi:hypothetical protein